MPDFIIGQNSLMTAFLASLEAVDSESKWAYQLLQPKKSFTFGGAIHWDRSI
jgi:hypothetical protein